MKHGKQNRLLALLMAVAMIVAMLPVSLGIPVAADAANEVYTVDFNEAEDLNDFASYYAQNARDGLTLTAFEEDWTNDGNVARLAKPHGIGGFWQSNVDGNSTYGYLAELVYTKRQFTNFELTVDAMQVAESISRQFGIGIGKTALGAFFVDNANQMNAAGGAYVGVERGGATNLWGYSVNTVNGSTGALANNARVQGTTVTSPSGTWHTVKVRVENSAVSMWVKNLGAEDSAYVQVLTNVALKNYQGGYISLMTNANAAFDNLTITNLDPQIISVESGLEIDVAQGTALDNISFPQKITVTDGNGNTYQAAVTFACDSYNANVLGEYTFTGTLDMSSVAAQNGSGLTASLVVNVLDPADIAATVSFDFNDAADLNVFAAYYADDARNGLTQAEMSANWAINNGIVERVQPAGKQYWMSNSDACEANGVGETNYGMVAELVYTARKYTNFELVVDARQVSGISRQFGVGFGKTELGAFFVDSEGWANVKGGAYACVERGNATNLWGYAVNTVNGSTGALVGGRVQGTSVSSGNSVEHTVKVRVEDSKMSMWVKAKGADDASYVKVLTDVALKDYNGGYISLMTSANAAFDNLTITNLDPQVVSVGEIEEIIVAQGTMAENISFPAQVEVTDVNGNTHMVAVNFICDSFDANTLGKYTFTGVLDMSGVAAQNSNGLTASVVVNVMTAEDVEARVSFNFNEAEDLNAFAAYYADDARLGLSSADMAANWAINNGIVERVQPENKQYWMSNSNVYEANGVGELNYGMVTELVYTAKQYTNFELTVDARQVSGISRQFGIGFGKTELGAFFVDSEGWANTAGGAYACVERGGAANLWGCAVNTINGSTGALVGGRVQGTTVTSENATWHTVKVRVEDSKMSMWVKNQGAADSSYVEVLTDVALKNYNGGYISLMTSANAAFDNLLIVNLGDPETAQIEKWNLTLGEDIGADFYVSIPEAQQASATATITVDGKTVDADLISTEDGLYKIGVNVAAAQMTEDIIVRIVCNGITVEETYSVYEYAQYILADEKNEFDEKTENLVKEMLNYGAAAQTYFGYNTGKVIDAELIAGAGAAQIDTSNVPAMSISGEIDGIGFYGASLLFKSKTAVRFYFTGDISECDVSVGTLGESNGMYYIENGEIAPQSLDEAITLTIQSGEESIAVTYGPMNYMERMSEKGSEDLQLLLKAMYNYHIAATEYVG